MMRVAGISFSVVVICLASCNTNTPQVFKRLYPEQTGINFNNRIEEDDVHNVYNYMNIYTGAGVAIGDINNDGLADIYFSGNMVTGRLYLNLGNMKFRDITESAGLVDDRWGTGAAMVDINQDGWTDIYVCVSGSAPADQRANLLYVNNGDNTFSEKAAEYGIDESRQSMHASFFDYDRDGDLDLFTIINSAAYANNVNVPLPRRLNGEAGNTDVLYRNNGDNTFTDVSREAGILIEGYSLGLAVSDINHDGWPDIYISNDFIGNDVFYINNADGTFTDRADEYLKHTSYAGMGNDLADVNNDGLVDIMVLDMRPEDNKRQKLIISSTGYDKFQLMLQKGYKAQYSRNTLQLNRGEGLFSEIGFLAGVSSTDWSWSALLADYDNDGDRDLFVTNGFLRDLGNLDYIHYQNIYDAPMGSVEAKIKNKLAAIKALEGAELKDYLYENTGGLNFSNRSEDWGIDKPGYSNGAAYADLDNDGDLELVVNNINEAPHIYENRTDQLFKRNFIQLKLIGHHANRDGIGAKISVKCNDHLQFYEHYPYRGYESTVGPIIHFGLGEAASIDSLEIFWPDGKYQLLRNPNINQMLTLTYTDAAAWRKGADKKKPPTILQEVSGEKGINYFHRENQYVDFKLQPILPHMHSRGGPGIAVGDINGDLLEDFYVGASSGRAGQFFIQQPSGLFDHFELPEDSIYEDMGVLLFDADLDLDLDLYVVSGGSAHPKGSTYYQDRLYLNDGSGNFSKSEAALPPMLSSGSSVVAGDYDRDGDLDLFVGGRVIPGEYPLPPRSYLLRNDTPPGGAPQFTDVTDKNPGLSSPGLVTTALWTDYDNDGWVDLLVAGEFMPLRFFHNETGHLIEKTNQTGMTHTAGWWNSLLGGDFDKDGDIDYMAGNLGLNSRLKASPQQPLCIYASDYDKNGRIDPVMCYYIQGENYLAHGRDEIIQQISAMRARFKTYEEYSEATFDQSFLPSELNAAYVVKSQRFESSYIENLGQGKFAIKSLPIEAQLSPVFAMAANDYDGDGQLDVLVAGNSYATEVSVGQYDASVGLYLKRDSNGDWLPVKISKSGFIADGDVKSLARIQMADGNEMVLVGNNAGALKAFSGNLKHSGLYRPTAMDVFADITLEDGTSYRHEFYHGSSYLSQSSRVIHITPGMKQITVTRSDGKRNDVVIGEYTGIQ
ncbi:VCBS repeat-containing protein [Fulvivirgaceae bacterium BMA12]|uniref:VCBS repeat-containing protein n=1 Tax=Agaribacillus aureus TaxID=3051825 RepID=A0ABT8KYM1_9BACT|nr:VCBS repeat-containing protein [Fulvivirgaceae bacterium BMA12]